MPAECPWYAQAFTVGAPRHSASTRKACSTFLARPRAHCWYPEDPKALASNERPISCLPCAACASFAGTPPGYLALYMLSVSMGRFLTGLDSGPSARDTSAASQSAPEKGPSIAGPRQPGKGASQPGRSWATLVLLLGISWGCTLLLDAYVERVSRRSVSNREGKEYCTLDGCIVACTVLLHCYCKRVCCWTHAWRECPADG